MPTIAALIAQGLANGLYHPGSKEQQQPPMTIRLPLQKSAAFSPQVNDEVQAMVKLMGEAIVHLIETEGNSVIIDRAELDELRAELENLRKERDELRLAFDDLKRGFPEEENS